MWRSSWATAVVMCWVDHVGCLEGDAAILRMIDVYGELVALICVNYKFYCYHESCWQYLP